MTKHIIPRILVIALWAGICCPPIGDAKAGETVSPDSGMGAQAQYLLGSTATVCYPNNDNPISVMGTEFYGREWDADRQAWRYRLRLNWYQAKYNESGQEEWPYVFLGVDLSMEEHGIVPGSGNIFAPGGWNVHEATTGDFEELGQVICTAVLGCFPIWYSLPFSTGLALAGALRDSPPQPDYTWQGLQIYQGSGFCQYDCYIPPDTYSEVLFELAFWNSAVDHDPPYQNYVLWILYYGTSPPEPEPQLAIEPKEHNFRKVPVGESRSQTFTLTNAGGGAASGEVFLDPLSSPDFEIIDGGGEFGPLEQNDPHPITVQFRPSAQGDRYAILTAKGDGCEANADIYGYGKTCSHSCPYVVIKQEGVFVRDNNILPQSEESRINGDVTDYYQLQVPLEPEDRLYSVRIAEFEHEHTWADRFELAIIDHSPNVKICVTEDGSLFTYSNLLVPIDVTSNLGAEHFELVSSVDGRSALLEPDEVVTINFGQINSDHGIRLVVDMKSDRSHASDGILTAPAPGTNAEKQAVLVQGVLLKPDPGDNLDFNTEVALRPRENGTVAVADVSCFLPDNGENFVLELKFPASHAVDFIGLDLSEQAAAEINKTPLIRASHSESGDVTFLLSDVDGLYAELVPGKYIDLAFDYLVPNDPSFSRDFILISTGHYKTIQEPEIAESEDSNRSMLDFQCYPNPFNPMTEISYVLPEACHVGLSVYNLLGQRVKTLVDEYQAAGHKTVRWDGTDQEGGPVASGIYFLRAQAGPATDVKKLMLIR